MIEINGKHYDLTKGETPPKVVVEKDHVYMILFIIGSFAFGIIAYFMF